MPDPEARRLAEEFARQLLAEMERRRISKGVLAQKVGCSLPWASEVLSGRANLTLNTVARFASALRLRIEVTLRPRNG